MVNIQIVKSFSRPKDQVFKWWLIIAPGEILPKSSMRSWQQYNIDKLYVYSFFKKEYKIQQGSCQKPNSLTKSIEVHFSRSNIFLLYFFEKKSLAEVLLTHAEEKWLCRISSFYEKRKTKQLKQNFSKSVETYGFL